MQSEGRRLHALAAQARETEKFKDSLSLNDQALFAYDTDKDTLGFAEGIACRSITLRVYAGLHKSNMLLTLAKYEMLGSVAIARESGDKKALALPLYNLAQIQEDLGELPDAVASYKEGVLAMEQTHPDITDKQAVLANMKVHMTTCEYKAGDKTALSRALAAQQELEQANEPNKYNKDVWISGGYLRLAEMLRTDNPSDAKMYLEKARGIIDANPDLTLRKKQWEQLAQTFE